MTNNVTIFVVDDDMAMCESLRWLIESVGFKVRTYNRASAFLKDYKTDDCGCLVLDVRMSEMSGLDLQEELNRRQINIPIIFITGHGDVPMAVRAIRAGAIEFLTKPFNDQLLLDTINRAIKQDQSQRTTRIQREEIQGRMIRLTPREREVMDLVVKGRSNKLIAGDLGISPKTVELHRAKIMDKMKAKSLAELVTQVLRTA